MNFSPIVGLSARINQSSYYSSTIFMIKHELCTKTSCEMATYFDIPTGLSYWHEWLPQVGLSGRGEIKISVWQTFGIYERCIDHHIGHSTDLSTIVNAKPLAILEAVQAGEQIID